MKCVDADAGPYRFDLTTGTPFGTPMARREVAIRYPCPRSGPSAGRGAKGATGSGRPTILSGGKLPQTRSVCRPGN